MIRVFFVFGVGALITSFLGPALGVHGGPAGLIVYAGVCVVLGGAVHGRNDNQGGGDEN